MKFLALTILIAAASADRRCTGVYFNDRYYDIDILKEGVNRIHQIILNRNDNTLYFTFDQIAMVPTRVLGYLNMVTRQTGLVEGIRNATALAIDDSYNKIYVGGSEGIFSITSSRIPQRTPIRDNIQSVFFKDVLYYTNKRREAFIYENGYVNPLFELQGVEADNLILDDDNNFFFTQGKNLFRVKRGTRAVNTHERFIVDVLTTDAYNKPYVCTRDGVYVYNKYKYVLDKVSHINNLRGLTFNKQNEPIYAVLDIIIKLNNNPVPCFEHGLV